MPTRVIREGILTSERVDRLSAGGEVFYRRLMSVVDDYGRFNGNPRVLLATCYPLRTDRVTTVDVEQWIEECVSAGLLQPYQVDGKGYLALLDFNQRLRAKVSKFPAPAHPASRQPASSSAGDGNAAAAYFHTVRRTPDMPAFERVKALWERYPGQKREDDLRLLISVLTTPELLATAETNMEAAMASGKWNDPTYTPFLRNWIGNGDWKAVWPAPSRDVAFEEFLK